MPKFPFTACVDWTTTGLHLHDIQTTGPRQPEPYHGMLWMKVIDLPPDHALSRLAETAVNMVAASSPKPDQVQIPGLRAIEGEITVVKLVEFRKEVDEPVVWASFAVTYSDGSATDWSKHFATSELDIATQQTLRNLRIEADQFVTTWYYEQFSKVDQRLVRWEGRKTEVFISYRSSREREARATCVAFGEWGNQSVFLPRMDRLEMQAGNWLPQLMELIARSQVFVALLSRDYLSGPITRPEIDAALRLQFADTRRKIIPVLLEGTPAE